MRTPANENASEHPGTVRHEAIDSLIFRLARAEVSECACNQYCFADQPDLAQSNGIRRENLRLYLRQMVCVGPKAMLVGEAPGYRGCRLTGVPFTSERILLKGREVAGARGTRRIFGAERGYLRTGESDQVTGEASASIVWQTIGDLQPLPLLWNAFPFHPFCAADPVSNRRPKVSELALGEEYLIEISKIYGIELVIAVGATAASAMDRAEIAYRKVRHPSHGGKAQFVSGLKQILRETRLF